jgi:beclin 1
MSEDNRRNPQLTETASKISITKDKIAGHPIKLSANMGMSSLGIVGAVPGNSVVQSTEAEESWTKALRAVLAVLKRILIVESETDVVRG